MTWTPHRRLFALGAVAGTVVPWIFFAVHIDRDGAGLGTFVEAVFANPAASGFTADLLITSVVFWIWSYRDQARHGMSGRWWWIVPANLFVGLSLAFPLYLVLRNEPEATVAA